MKYESEFYHHGILGQKWGKRNGPPYPLNTTGISSKKRKKISKVENKTNNSVSSIQKDIDNFSKYEKTGITNKKGKTVMSSEDVKESIKGLKAAQDKIKSESQAKIDKIKGDSRLTETTKNVISDMKKMSDEEFSKKYSVSKNSYAARLDKYGDPFREEMKKMQKTGSPFVTSCYEMQLSSLDEGGYSKEVKALMSDLSIDYTVAYDITTGKYTVKKK